MGARKLSRGCLWALAGFVGGAALLVAAVLAWRAADHRAVEKYVSESTGCPLAQVRVKGHLPSLFEDDYDVEACGKVVNVRCAAQDGGCFIF